MVPAAPLRVFLVEDSPIIVGLLTRLLHEDVGASVVGASGDAVQAIAELVRLEPDIAVVDLLLSSGTGYDVLKALRESLSRTTAIVLSSFNSAEHRNAARKLGVVDAHFLDKSSEIPKLLALIRTLGAERSA